MAQAYTGLTADELRTALRDGSTVAELIEANGESVDAYVEAAVAEAQTKLDEAVTEGRISQEQADEMAANLEDNVTAMANGEFEGREIFGQGHGGF